MAMLAAQAPGIKGALFRTALDAKIKRLHATGDNTHAFWDRLVFKKVCITIAIKTSQKVRFILFEVQAVLGGKISVMTCGSAPISVDAMDFMKVAFSCDVIEGEFFLSFHINQT